MSFAVTAGVKSYNVELKIGGGVHHIAAGDFVNGFATTSWAGLAGGDYMVCVKDQASSTQFGGCQAVHVTAPSVQLKPQAITFSAIAGHTYGDAPLTVSATGGASGNPVTFAATGPCTTSGTNGTTVTLTGAGTCAVTASQNGDATYAAATAVTQSFSIAPKSLTLVLATPSFVYGDAVALDCTLSGVINNDDVSAQCTSNAHQGSAVGVYTVSAVLAGTSAANYVLAATTTNVSITPAPAVATTADARRTFGQSNPTCTYIVVGAKMGETLASQCAWNADASSKVGGSPYGQVNNAFTCVAADGSGCSTGNYSFSRVGQLTVLPYNCGNGFTQPIALMPPTKADTKLGSAVPAKFSCVDLNGAPILNATASFTYYKAGVPQNTYPGVFRLVDATIGQYLYKFDTNGLAGSTSYQIEAALNDGTSLYGWMMTTAK